ncbi:MAG: winged helix-turn-helix transcriptional regulator [Spirochaetota bacterium]
MSSINHRWTFFTNHSHVLFYIYFHPELPMRDIAGKVGITERAVHTIIKDLEEVGVITVTKIGRNNTYEVNRNIPLRHQIESHRTISDLLDIIGAPEDEVITGEQDTEV